MKLITTKGDDGKGCYAGLQIILFGFIKIPLFWKDFFAQDYAKEHDEWCDKIDYWLENPQQALDDYTEGTEIFIGKCRYRSEVLSNESLQTDQAEFWAEVWGRIRYALAMAGFNF